MMFLFALDLLGAQASPSPAAYCICLTSFFIHLGLYHDSSTCPVKLIVHV